jgi:hypothetical protein
VGPGSLAVLAGDFCGHYDLELSLFPDLPPSNAQKWLVGGVSGVARKLFRERQQA